MVAIPDEIGFLNDDLGKYMQLEYFLNFLFFFPIFHFLDNLKILPAENIFMSVFLFFSNIFYILDHSIFFALITYMFIELPVLKHAPSYLI